MGRTQLTLLVEDLANLAGALTAGKSCPSIELLLSRGSFLPGQAQSADGQRMALFGYPDRDVPFAALTRLAEDGASMPGGRYCLRADAVTQRADMIRVFMTGAGLGDLPEREQQDLSHCIDQVFDSEGLNYSRAYDGSWILELETPPGFRFMPLDDALGMDMADALPPELEARNWRRIINEAQVALHNHPVNIENRQAGRMEVNGIWLWGGGGLPEPAQEPAFDSVFAMHPVTRGLAVLNGCEWRSLGSSNPDRFKPGERVLIDWTVESRDADAEVERLESLFHGLLAPLRNGSLALRVASPEGRSWEIDRSALRRFWRRRASLPDLIERYSP